MRISLWVTGSARSTITMRPSNWLTFCRPPSVSFCLRPVRTSISLWGYKRRALDDYNAAIRSAPHNATLYYNRGVSLFAQANYDAALQDFDTALELDSKFVPALRQRAKIYTTRANLAGALADYSEAIRLQPKTAALMSDRGQVDLGRHEYGNAIEDESARDPA